MENTLPESESELHEVLDTTDTLHCPGDIDAKMIPEAEELLRRNRRNIPAPPAPPLPQLSDDGLIVPRKLNNPCVASRGHQELRRELLFNQKIGKSVVGQKSELQRALEKHKEHQERAREQESKVESQLEQIIHERARRIEEKEKSSDESNELSHAGTEFLAVHAKLRSRVAPK